MDEDRAKKALDELIKDYEQSQKRTEKAEANPMKDLKKALWDKFERPYAKYGI